MLPGKTYTPERIAGVLVRKRWIILVPFALGVALAPLLAGVVPKRYRSETLILVVPQRVPDAYVKPTVTASVEDRLPAISEQILSRSRLERIIDELDLYPVERQRTVMEDVVARMRTEDIALDLAANERTDEVDSFRISYVSDSPTLAQKVTERLASMTIDQNVQDRENQAESTNQFLAAQLEDAKRRLVEHEKKLEDYKRRHTGELPSQLQSNMQSIGNAQLQLQAASESLNRARERRLLVERQIADAQALSAAAVTTPVSEPAPASAAQQLATAQARLKAAALVYTPDHPDMRSLERTVAELQAKAQQEGSVVTAQERPLSALELTNQKRILDLKAELEVIDVQLEGHAAEEKRLKETIAAYQTKVDVLPTRELELVELTRDYETLEAGYRTLLTKWEESKIAANLERGQIGEQFRIVDPASLPERPFNEVQRLGVTASGAIAGLVLGLLTAIILEFRDATFSREEDVVRALTLPVLALVPAVTTDTERRRQRWRMLASDSAGIALLVLSAVVLGLSRPWQ